LAGTAANVTDGETGARTATRTLTGGTENCGVNLNALFGTENNFFKRHFDTKQGILATFRSGSRAALTAASAEERVKNIAETTETRTAKWVLASHVVLATR
jgi:hypothetical protein